MAIAALKGAGRLLLIRVRRGQRRVDVEHRPLARRLALARGIGPQRPRTSPRRRDRAAQALKALLIDRIDDPKRRRVRRHPPEQVDLVAQRAQVGQANAAVCEHHRHVEQHYPGSCAEARSRVGAIASDSAPA